jgi:hypothetical protein
MLTLLDILATFYQSEDATVPIAWPVGHSEERGQKFPLSHSIVRFHPTISPILLSKMLETLVALGCYRPRIPARALGHPRNWTPPMNEFLTNCHTTLHSTWTSNP